MKVKTLKYLEHFLNVTQTFLLELEFEPLDPFKSQESSHIMSLSVIIIYMAACVTSNLQVMHICASCGCHQCLV